MRSQNSFSERIQRSKHSLKRHRKLVTCLAAVVVFAVTYSLVLPAVTLDEQKAEETSGIETQTKVEEQVEKAPVNEKQETQAIEKADAGSQGDASGDSGEKAKASAKSEGSDSSASKDSGSAVKSDKKDSGIEESDKDKSDKDAKESSENDNKLIDEKTELQFDGNGYKVVAEVDADAKLPADTKLKVKEIKDGDKNENDIEYVYDAYCDEALKAVRDKDGEDGENLSRQVKLYDIKFVSESSGKDKVEPAAPVKVTIEYDEAIEKSDKNVIRAVHFDDTDMDKDKAAEAMIDKDKLHDLKKVVLETKSEKNDSDSMKDVQFKSDRFSVYGIVYTVKAEDKEQVAANKAKNVLTAKGDNYVVTVSYDNEAQIPEGAELHVEELAKDDEAYIDFQKDASENLKEGADSIPEDPALFDISIWADGQEIEPAEGSDVKVEIKMDKDSLNGLFTDEDTPLLVNEEPITEEMGDIDNSMQVIHRVEEGEFEVMDTDDKISNDEVVSEFTTDSFSDWLLFLDETVENITIGVDDTLTLRPYSKWVWKRNAEEEQYQNYKWQVPTSSSIISFNEETKTDDQLNETYVYYNGKATGTGEFDLQLKDGDNVVHTIHVTVVDDVPDLPGTIQGTSDIKINLFDYDLNPSDPSKSGSLDAQSNVASNTDNSSVNKYSDLKFLGYGGSNTNDEWFVINNYTKDVPSQGIVQNRLVGGFPQLGKSANGNTRGQPSLAYLFNTSSRNNDVYAYPNLTGLFQKDTEGYYFYNSNSNYAYYDINGGSNQITLYEHTYSQWTTGSHGHNAKPIGFFPFHKYDSYLKEGNVGMNFNTNLNHHFGMSMAVDFEIPSDGLDEHGNPIIFEFSGDDDMWVFIDDNLVLDVGGIHQPVTGSIDFSNDKVHVYGKADTTITQRFTDAQSPTQWQIGDGKPHTMKIFYLERGGCDSNLSVRFNTPTRFGKGKLALVKREANTTTPIQGAKFSIWNNAKCEGDPIREFTSDEHGKIDFGDFVIKSGSDTYYMKETESANGYLRDTSVYEVKPRLDGSGNVVKDSSGDYITLDVFKKGSSTPLNKLENDSVVFPNVKSETIDIPVKKTWIGDPMPGAQVKLTIKRYKLIDKTKGFVITKSLSGEPEDYTFDADYKITYPDGNTETVSYSQFNDGVYSIPNAEPGRYVIEEIVKSERPEGYDMTHTPTNNRVEITLEEDAMAQADFKTTFERQKGEIYIKANLSFQNGSSNDIDYSRVKYVVLDANGKKVTSITHEQALTGTSLQLPTGDYSVKSVGIPTTPTDYDRTVQKVVCGNREEDGTIIKNITVSKNQQTEVDFNTTYVKQNNAQNCTWRIMDQYGNEVYKTGKVNYPVGTVLRMSFQVPQSGAYDGSNNYDVSYGGQSLNGSIANVQNNYEFSVEFTVRENTQLTYRINRNKNNDGMSGNDLIAAMQGPTFEVVSHAKNMNSAASNKVSSGSKKAIKANNLNLRASNEATHPDAPSGMKYIKDSEWSQQVTLNSGNDWEDVLDNLPATDDEGNKYYYYVDSVTESGLGDGTVCSIDLDGGSQLLIGQDLNNEEGIALGVTNKRCGSLKITKEVTVNNAEVVDHSKESPADGTYTFKIRKKGDASFAERTVTITITNGEADTAEVSNLDEGTYIVEEVVPTNGTELTIINGSAASGYTAEVSVQAGRIGASAPTVKFTNNIVDTSLTIVKKDSKTNGPIEGAKFTLTKVDSDGHDIMTEGEAYSEEKTSGADGKLEFTGLRMGRYKLVETFVPSGYVKKEEAYYITIDASGSGNLDTSFAHTMISPESGNEYIVKNEPGAALPSAGGPGTTWMYILGMLMVVGAGMTLAVRRRMRAY